jgi:glycosyltransferase involved in cell wall biosynthesis
MSFEEASGQYSLMDCIHLTAAKYQTARPEFHVDEQPAFPELLDKTRSNTFSYPLRRLILDISNLLRQWNLTGIGRVELELARQLVAMAKITGDIVALTAFDGKVFQEYVLVDMALMAPTYGLKATGVPVHFRPGDQFLLIELNFSDMEKFFTAIYQARRAGAAINYMIHDLIPIANTTMVDESFAREFFIGWSQILRFADRLITVSRKVSRDVACYVAETSLTGLVPMRALPVAYFVLGCDILKRNKKADTNLAYPADRNTLVAAGTFMKHKGLNDLVTAMGILWAEGSAMRLVLLGGDVGKGNARAYLSSLPAFGSKLFLPGYVSDMELAETMSRCGAMVCASRDEGFGLPLVEAAALGCPVIARDIEIFRETSGGKAFFFENGDAGKIAEALRRWFALTRKQQLTFVPKESLVTWKQSAEMLKAIMFQGIASFSVEVGIKATVNLAVPDRTAGAV